MTLSKDQIDLLFEFTRKKYVQHYDVQVELVDHLAATIEAAISENPTLSFENALQKVYAGFGIFGFAKVVQEKQQAVEKLNSRLWRQAFVSYFTLPRIALTSMIFVLCYWITSMLPTNFSGFVIIAIWTVFLVYEIWFIRKEKKFKPRKPLLLYRDPMLMGTPGFVVYQICISNNHFITNPWFVAIAGAILFVMQASVVQVYKTIRNKAIQLYPEAFQLA